MKIEDIIRLWNRSKYDTIFIESLPCVNHEREITFGTGIYRKGETILCGGKYEIEDYLKSMYKGSIFMLDSVDEYYLTFKMIMKGNVESENNNI